MDSSGLDLDSSGGDMVHLHDAQDELSGGTEVTLRQPQEDQGMLEPEVVDLIHELAGQGLGSKRIAQQVGVSRNCVRRYLAGAKVGYQERPAARCLDDATRQTVLDLYGTVAEGNTVVIQQELEAQGIRVDLRTLQRTVAPLRQEQRARKLATVRFETKPGQQMQIDFGEKFVRIGGIRVKVHLMTAVLGYSRRIYCRAFLSQRQDDWLEGIDGACRQFGGVPRQILCDNASPLVTSHDSQTGTVVWNPGFEAFCKDRGIIPRACRPRRARTKGKIENGVGYVKHNALAGRSFDTFVALEHHLSRWSVEVADCRIHGTTQEQPQVRFERDEREAMRPLPARPLAVRTRRLTRRVSADGFVDVDTVRSSVPYQHVREFVEVVVGLDQVQVWLRGTCIASHVRCFTPHTWVRDPAHFQGLYRAELPEPGPAAPPVAPDPNPVARPLAVYSDVVEGGQQ
jgi:transposase